MVTAGSSSKPCLPALKSSTKYTESIQNIQDDLCWANQVKCFSATGNVYYCYCIYYAPTLSFYLQIFLFSDASQFLLYRRKSISETIQIPFAYS